MGDDCFMIQTAQQPSRGDYAHACCAGALVIGESLIDVVGDARYAGGSPMNVAVGLGRLGRPVRLATWFGHDADGALLAQHLAKSGVDLVQGSDGASHTPTAQVRFDETGSASYVFDLEWRLPAAFVADAQTPVPVVVHTGSIAAVLAPGASEVADMIGLLAGRTAVSFDVNVRPQIIGPLTEVRPRAERLVALADIVKASDEDLEWLYPGMPPLESARRWASGGSALVVCTKGADGVVAITHRGEIEVPAPKVQVVDTVGAGDAFMAGMLHALWGAGMLGANSAALRDIDETTLRHALDVATRVAAITLSRPGADPPWANEIS